MSKRNTTAVVSILIAVFICALPVWASPLDKPRVLILTDIGADPDDTQSLVRLFLYSNAIDIEGLIATTSVWQKRSVAPESIEKLVQAYAKVQTNLLLHQAGFPLAESLSKLIKQGLPVYGMEGVGAGKNSQGSDWIIRSLEKDDPRPLWVSVWGGVNTLAQALHTLRETKSAAELQRLVARLRVYAISDQDDSGVWIRREFPDLFYIVSPGDYYGNATWTAINMVVDGIDNQSISNSWLAANIQQHGPLGAAYPDVAWGMEGDTPAFLGLIPNGLNVPEHPEWGGWGGRYELYKPDFANARKGDSGVPFEPETRPIWTNASDRYTPFLANEYGRTVRKSDATFESDKVSLWRWRDDIQNDFAARMDWTVNPYQDANHPPVPVIEQGAEVSVKSGEGFVLEARDSSDPDGDSLSFLWFQYPEAGSRSTLVDIRPPENASRAYIVAPQVEHIETAHVILRLSDKGTPSLSRYQRVVVTVLPE